MKTLVFCLCTLILVTPIWAQTSSKSTHKPVPKATQSKDSPLWPNEPTSFLGIKFDVPLTDSLAECAKHQLGPTYSSYTKEEDVQTPCWEAMGSLTIIVGISPFMHAFVDEYDGKVGNVTAIFNESRLDEIHTALVEKYGKPQVDFAEKKQNGFGARFTNQQLMWFGDKLSLVFNPIGVREDEGDVSMKSHEYDKYSEAKRKQATEGVKGVL